MWQKQTLRLSPGGAGFSSLRRDYSESLLLLMVTACCVLLVACANIANLLLARGLKKPATDGGARGAGRIARAPGEECAA